MKKLALLAGILGLSSQLFAAPDTQQTANISMKFFDFRYEGRDPIFTPPLAKNEFQNPVIAGFYPDPSVVRVGEDYYLATSSFSYSPGVPLFHSKDLVNWQSIGHALITHEQLPLFNQTVSRGIYAPTLRYHEGTFYLITTIVDVVGNFIVTAKDPRGPWSAPILLPEVGGIDPDIFFDDDGRVYISHNDGPPGEPLYEGHRAIWLWEYDKKHQRVIPESKKLLVNGGVDLSQKPIWIEAPHIYKINGWYYLVCAEGGTSMEHSAVVFRSRSLDEPFVPYDKNPILTQRDLDPNRPNPITAAGHADLVQTKEGEWWAVFLATRSYNNIYFNTGRETFLHPVSWTEDQWPVILPAGETLPYRMKKPSIKLASKSTQPTTGNFSWFDSFERTTLDHAWVSLRSGNISFYQLNPDQGAISLTAQPWSLSETKQPSFLARRQQHMHFTAETYMGLPTSPGISGGISAFQSEQAHYYFGVKQVGKTHQWFVEQTEAGKSKILAKGELDSSYHLQTLRLGIEGDAGLISFYYVNPEDKKITVVSEADASLLSTEKAGGFTGVMLGMHTRVDSQSFNNLFK